MENHGPTPGPERNGVNGLASKGVTRTGEAYCLSCYQIVERGEAKCPGCGADFTEEVKAFACPKCQTIMVLGSPQCPSCGLKFRVKTLKPGAPAEDDKLLMKLIQLVAKPPAQSGQEHRVAPQAGPASPPDQGLAPASEEQLRKFGELRESIKDLMTNRSEMLARMERRIAEEKERLTQISSMDPKSATAEQVEAEIMSLAAEMADITMLQAHMDALSDEISTLMESVQVSDAAKERGLAARALRKKVESQEKELAELKEKEAQLRGREEMVDRKIQGYAHRKKELDDQEEQLKLTLTKLEAERAEIERLSTIAKGARTEAEREQAGAEWREEQVRLHARLKALHSKVASGGAAEELTDQEMAADDADLEKTIGALEDRIGGLMVEKADLQKRTAEAAAVDEDLKRLLRVLDQMLGQLPEEAIERFSRSDEFVLYERLLDKFKI